MNELIKDIKPIKYKEASIYPSITKDMAFIVDKDLTSDEIMKTIKKVGGRLLKDIDVFDIYTGDNIGNNKKSIAYKLEFVDTTKTLTDNEVNIIFNNIIKEVEKKHNAKVRDN